MNTITMPADALTEKPKTVERVLNDEVAAANVCPACGAQLVFRGCKGICNSKHCVHRIVITCSDS